MIQALVFVFIVTATLIPTLVFAVDNKFIPLVGIPGFNPDTVTTGDYINLLYRYSIGFAIFATFVQLMISGIQYIGSDVITDKSTAVNRIKSALLGLIIVLGAVVILETINPDLKNLNFLRNADKFVDSAPPAPEPVFDKPTQCKESDAACVNRCNAEGGALRNLGVGSSEIFKICDYPTTTLTPGDTIDTTKECPDVDTRVTTCNSFCKNTFDINHEAKTQGAKVFCVDKRATP